MPTEVYLVRHAHSTYTPDEQGRPLSCRGIADATTVIELLKYEGIDKVYSSPYKRAIQTVEGIATHVDQEIRVIDSFKERTLADEPVNDFKYAISKVWADYDFSWSGGESNRVAQKRGIDALLQILSVHSGSNIVIGTHGNPMVLLMNYFDNRYGFNFWRQLEMPDIYKLSFNGENLLNVKRIWEPSE